MPFYQQICIICQEEFVSERVNGTMCSKKCRNRSRSLSPDMLARLRRRNSLATKPLDNTNSKQSPIERNLMQQLNIMGIGESEANVLIKQAQKRKATDDHKELIKRMEAEEKAEALPTTESEIEPAKEIDLTDIM